MFLSDQFPAIVQTDLSDWYSVLSFRFPNVVKNSYRNLSLFAEGISQSVAEFGFGSDKAVELALITGIGDLNSVKMPFFTGLSWLRMVRL